MTSRPTPRWQRKSTVILGTVLFGIAAFGATTRTWLDVKLPQTAVQTPDIAVAGSDAATAVTAFAVVAIAAGLAASIAGHVARWIVAVLLLVSGVGVVIASLTVISDPLQGAAGAIGKALGVSSAEGIDVTLTAMPWLAAAAGVLIALSGVWLAVAGRGWKSSRRYAAAPAPAAAGTAAGSNAAAGTAEGNDDDGTAPIDDIDSWDRLTKGDDPTTYR